MCKSKDCQHGKESPIKDWKHRCQFGPDGKKLKKGTLIKGWNDLATTHDELVKECLDDTTDVTGSSSKSKKWKCKVCGHEWSGIVRNRTNGHGCKPCGDKASAKKRRTFPYEKSVAFFYPHLIKDDRGPNDLCSLGPQSNLFQNWECSVCGHKWSAKICNRANGRGCKPCRRKAGAQKHSTVPYEESVAFLFPHLAKEHRGPRNLGSLGRGSDFVENWECSECGHKWPSTVSNRVKGQGCKKCGDKEGSRKRSTVPYEESAAFLYPHLVKDHQGPNDLSSLSAGSNLVQNWKCADCGHEWTATVNTRAMGGCGCRECADTGFKTAKPSLIYMLYRPGQIKYGIMNIGSGRLEKHRRKGWQVIDEIRMTGWNAKSLEDTIKQTLSSKDIPTGRKAFREKFDGSTEAFQEVDLYVRSIKELCQSLGIDLDAFLAA
jgi:transposase-like protein